MNCFQTSTDQPSGVVWPLVIMGHVSWVPQVVWASVWQGTWTKVRKSGQTSITKMCWCVLGNVDRSDRWLEQQSWAMRGGSQTTHQLLVREKPRSRESMCVVWMTHSGVTQVKSHWKRYVLRRSRSRGCVQLGRFQDGWPQRSGAGGGIQVVIPSEVALQLGNPTR